MIEINIFFSDLIYKLIKLQKHSQNYFWQILAKGDKREQFTKAKARGLDDTGVLLIFVFSIVLRYIQGKVLTSYVFEPKVGFTYRNEDFKNIIKRK